MTYIPNPDHFAPHEFVPPSVFDKLGGNQVKIFRLFDERILKTSDRLRKRYGPLTINNWFWGGEFKESGLRVQGTDTGASWSQHKFGRALDSKPRDISAEDIRQDILADPFHPDFQFITCLEMNISWLHIDCRNWDKKAEGILKIYP